MKRKENGRLNELKCAAVYLLDWIILSGSSNFQENCVYACCADVNKNTIPTQKLLSSELGHSYRGLTSTFARHVMNEEPFLGFSWCALEDGWCGRREISTFLSGRFVPSISLPHRGCGAAVCLGLVILTSPDLLCLLNSGTFQATFFFFPISLKII